MEKVDEKEDETKKNSLCDLGGKSSAVDGQRNDDN